MSGSLDVTHRRRLTNDAPPQAPSLLKPLVDAEAPPTLPVSSVDVANAGNFLLDLAPTVKMPFPSAVHDKKMNIQWQRVWHIAKQPQHVRRLALGACLSVVLFLLVARPSHTRPPEQHRHGLVGTLGTKAQKRDTLVAYVFQDFDPEALTNLRFFVDHGMQPDDRCEYVVVVQRADNKTELSWLPAPLPPNARYVFNPFYMQDCNDWGIYGWLISSGTVSPRQYQYFFFLNSAIRGPYFPAYLQNQMHWTAPFVHKLNAGNVKLVGPSVRCVKQRCITEEDPDGVERVGPALQNLWATDQAGLQLLLDDGGVFQCHHEPSQALCRSELGASLAVLAAGFNIDTLMLRYQGVDWQQRSFWGCNLQYDPMAEHQYDGVTVDPLETMFVRMDQEAVETESYFASKAIKYQRWAAELARGAPSRLKSNEYGNLGVTKFKAWKIIEMWGRGQRCFDFAYYRQHNSDVRVMRDDACWKHFLTNGQFEGRKYRFKCNVDADSARQQLVRATGLDISM